MATQTVRALSVAVGPLFSWESLEGQLQTFRAGAPLVFSSGALVEASADPNMIAGLALRPGQNLAGTGSGALLKKTQYAPLLPGTIIEGNIVGSATEVAYVLRGSAVGLVCGIIKRTAEALTPWAIDANERRSTAVNVRIIGMKDASGDINGRVYAIVLASRSVWGGGA